MLHAPEFGYQRLNPKQSLQILYEADMSLLISLRIYHNLEHYWTSETTEWAFVHQATNYVEVFECNSVQDTFACSLTHSPLHSLPVPLADLNKSQAADRQTDTTGWRPPDTDRVPLPPRNTLRLV
jgi:hypothetical protein